MFESDIDFPIAVASYDDEGIAEAIEWCLDRMEKGDTLTVWTSLKSNLRNCSRLERLVNGYSDVEHVTGRGGTFVRGPGPVLMAWANMDDIAKVVRGAGPRLRGLAVINWNEDWLRPWVASIKPDLLGDTSLWEGASADLDPVVVEALKSITQVINHSNTISAGFEKDHTVGPLLALRDARIPMDPEAIQAWAVANGWSGRNPQKLADYVRDINNGKRPRVRYGSTDRDFVARMRQRAEAGGDD